MEHTRAKKNLGQHFLINAETIRTILSAIHPVSIDHIVEIGPGRGAITKGLIERCAKLSLIELDRDLVPLLQEQYRSYPDLVVYHENALGFDFNRLATAQYKLRVVGNLPYNISTPLLFHLLGFWPVIADFHFMLQREVVHRISANTGDRNYNRLSLAVQNICHVQCLFDVPPADFRPQPKVHSSFLRLTPRNQPLVASELALVFQKVTTAAFMQARKTLRNSLRTYLSDDEIRTAGIDPAIRPQYVSLQEFRSLAEIIAQRDAAQ